MNSSNNSPRLALCADLNGFFRDLVEDTMQKSGYRATDAAGMYVAELLADYARPDELGEEALCRPLTLLLDEAQRATGLERFERLRSLGDSVLYVSGFFGDHLENRGVELSYVAMLGATAYENAAAMLRAAGQNTGGEGAPDVFTELGDKFQMFVDLLSDVAGTLLARSATSDRALLKMYERWQRTGSGALAQVLTSHGMVPARPNGAVH